MASSWLARRDGARETDAKATATATSADVEVPVATATPTEVTPSAVTAEAAPEPSGSRRLTDAIRALLEDTAVAIDNRLLTDMADDAFGGSRASGAYTVKDAYDAVEVAANEFLAHRAARLLQTDGREGLAEIRETLLARLPRQTDGDRTEEMERAKRAKSLRAEEMKYDRPAAQ